MTYIKGSKFFDLATILVEDKRSIEIIEKVAYIQNLKQKGFFRKLLLKLNLQV